MTAGAQDKINSFHEWLQGSMSYHIRSHRFVIEQGEYKDKAGRNRVFTNTHGWSINDHYLVTPAFPIEFVSYLSTVLTVNTTNDGTTEVRVPYGHLQKLYDAFLVSISRVATIDEILADLEKKPVK